ncbi:uncharacterized protein BO96DRAFT_475683 [Aspergillus niger CBS 101883]|uniref:uncharacterized protein n=1 Tax=Aspergillus lacticoffeatus (strain CBS 101883) TaxID=1450533 RepID=UPI000D7F8EF8|nr:uncharacterized protein BO96DRAFT_475683 [Aspergillus niger CBS 101883]PYH56102.1 hypothetical protein BO96DRAFT_475683 [Aspergillus niger CBS 101883]
MLPPQPEHTNIPFSAEPDTFDQHLIQLGVLPVSPHRLMDALAQDGLNIKSLSVPSHLSESIPQEYIYVVSKLRFEAYRAIWIMRYCDFWYRKRFEFLCPAQANIYIQHKRSVQLLLGWDDFNTPIRASPSPADPKLPQDLIFLRTDRCTYATYFQFHHTTVWNTRLGVYYARYYRYLVVAKHILERDPLPSGVSEKLDTWWQGEFLAEMKKWLDASQKVLFAPSYDAAVNELATVITGKIEDGIQIAQTFSSWLFITWFTAVMTDVGMRTCINSLGDCFCWKSRLFLYSSVDISIHCFQ